MAQVVARILLRYLIGALGASLVAMGLIAPEMVEQFIGDPDVITVLASILSVIGGAIVEVWYWLVKRRGGAT